MTPQEIRAECNALASLMPAYTQVELSISASRADEKLVRGYFSLPGRDSPYVFVYGDTWEEAASKLRAKWIEISSDHEATITRDMALKIIEITALNGECTDAALRQHFDASDIKRFGSNAVEQANEMAANGPFSIVEMAGANAA